MKDPITKFFSSRIWYHTFNTLVFLAILITLPAWVMYWIYKHGSNFEKWHIP